MRRLSSSLHRHTTAGAWNGPGLTSSIVAAGRTNYGIGYADSALSGNPAGLPATTVEAKPTLLGDTQLRGQVGLGDYDTVLTNYGNAEDWTGGDFHYGGVVGLGDYNDVLSNYGAPSISGSLTAGPSLTRSISPDLAKTDLKLEVNTTTGDVYIASTASAAFTGYTISDPSAHSPGRLDLARPGQACSRWQRKAVATPTSTKPVAPP